MNLVLTHSIVRLMAERALLSLESRNSDAGNQYGTMEADLTAASHNNSQWCSGRMA